MCIEYKSLLSRKIKFREKIFIYLLGIINLKSSLRFKLSFYSVFLLLGIYMSYTITLDMTKDISIMGELIQAYMAGIFLTFITLGLAIIAFDLSILIFTYILYLTQNIFNRFRLIDIYPNGISTNIQGKIVFIEVGHMKTTFMQIFHPTINFFKTDRFDYAYKNGFKILSYLNKRQIRRNKI